MGWIEVICAVAGLVLLGGACLAHLKLARWAPAAEPVRRPLRRYPSVTVIHPVRGLDFGARLNIAATLDADYPGALEVLYVFDDDTDPTIPLVRDAMARQRKLTASKVRLGMVFCGPPPPRRTGKLNAMIAGLEAARGELIAFVDSDLRPTRDALRTLVETLETTWAAGAAFAPVVVSEPPVTVGDAGYALLLNALYGPAAAPQVAENGGTLPFIMGQFMVLRREAIELIGGLEVAEGQLVDDMYLGAQLHENGLRNAVSPRRVAVIQRELPLASFVSVFLRWMAFSRTGLPAQFKLGSWLRGLNAWLALLLAPLCLALGAPVAASINLLALLAVVGSINRLHRRYGGAPLPLGLQWVSLALLLVGPLVLLSLLTRREVSWRGRSYSLDGQSRLGGEHRTLRPDRV